MKWSKHWNGRARAALIACSLAYSAAYAAPDASAIKVMTYNIRCSYGDPRTENAWELRRQDMTDQIERENPDIAGFQEVVMDQRKWLEAHFKDYAFIGDSRNADRKGGEASPVMYRKSRFEAVKSGTFWLSETPDKPGSKSWNTAYPRICTYAILKDKTTGKTFAFANTHTDHKSEEAREKGMLLIIERMKEFGKDLPIVFTGDHNCLENTKPALAVSKILKDAIYLSETPPEGPWRTCNDFKWKGESMSIVDALKLDVQERTAKAGARIDYIYVSPGVKVLSYRTDPSPRPGTHLYPSDHFPSSAVIQLP